MNILKNMDLCILLQGSLQLSKVILVILTFFSLNTFSETYRVMLPEIPERINYKDYKINYNFFILNQLYEPLLKITGNGFQSRILSFWNSSHNSKEFKLCYNDGLSFSNGKDISLKTFKTGLEGILDRMNYSYSLVPVDSKCVRIFLKKSEPDFFKRLVSFEFVLTYEDEGGIYGISPYEIESFIPGESLVLTTKKPFRFKKILFKKSFDFERISPLEVHEYNFMKKEVIPEIVKEKFRRFSYFLVEATYLLINIKNSKIREILFNCLDRKKLHEIVYGNIYSLKKMNTFFPLGVFENLNPKIEQKCIYPSLKNKVQFTFYYFEKNSNGELLINYMNEKLKSIGISIKLKKIEIGEFVKILQSNEKKYDLAIIAHGGRSIEEYLSSFFNSNFRYRVLNEAENFEKTNKRLNIKQSVNYLVNKRPVLPLVQLKKFFYYPAEIEIPKVGNERDINNYKIYEIK